MARVIVREIRETDADSLLSLQHALDAESSMMMLEPGERTTTAEELRLHVRQTLISSNSTILVALDGDRVVGYVEAEGGRYRRTRHTVYVVIGVRREWQGRGLGAALLAALERWAEQAGVSRLELTVRTDNEPARRAYERAGYVTEGVRRESLIVGGRPVDELMMVRLLTRQTSG